MHCNKYQKKTIFYGLSNLDLPHSWFSEHQRINITTAKSSGCIVITVARNGQLKGP